MNGLILVEPDLLQGVHSVEDELLVRELMSSLRMHGWQGRPLLAERHDDIYVGWTGTHRVTALQRLKRQGITIQAPVVLVDLDKLRAAGFKPGKDGFFNQGIDAQRLHRLRKAGDMDAYDIMKEEVKKEGESLAIYLNGEYDNFPEGLAEFFPPKSPDEAYDIAAFEQYQNEHPDFMLF